MEYVGYIIAGFLTGLLSGLIGIGGGVVMVPALVAIFSWQGLAPDHLMQIATGTSLAAMIMTTGTTTWANHKQGSVDWRIFRLMIPGTVIGAVIGVFIAKQIETQLLQKIFGGFAILLALRILWGANGKAAEQPKTNHPILVIFIGLMTGILSGLLGLGGGVILIPVLLWFGLAMRQSSATSAACAFPTSISGAIMAVVAGWHITTTSEHYLGFVYWPTAIILGIASVVGAPLGVKLANSLPVHIIKRIFAVILMAIAVKMMWPD